MHLARPRRDETVALVLRGRFDDAIGRLLQRSAPFELRELPARHDRLPLQQRHRRRLPHQAGAVAQKLLSRGRALGREHLGGGLQRLDDTHELQVEGTNDAMAHRHQQLMVLGSGAQRQ
jgi:hypothetical protein